MYLVKDFCCVEWSLCSCPVWVLKIVDFPGLFIQPIGKFVSYHAIVTADSDGWEVTLFNQLISLVPSNA